MNQVARAFGVHHSTLYRLAQRLQTTGTVADRPRSGAPRVTTPRQDRAIRRQHLQDRFQTAASTARATQGQRGGLISSRTVRRRLADINIRCRRPYNGPILTDRYRRERRAWVANRGYLGHGVAWRDVIFSDESRFCISHQDGRILVYRRPGERYQDGCVLERDRYGGASVMVWGGGPSTPISGHPWSSSTVTSTPEGTSLKSFSHTCCHCLPSTEETPGFCFNRTTPGRTPRVTHSIFSSRTESTSCSGQHCPRT